MSKFIRLNNGRKMPTIGLGTFSPNEGTAESLNQALEAGYRHMDASYIHKCETTIGGVLQDWLSSGKVKREELFITTKLPPTGMRPEHVEHFLKKSLDNLKLSYVDMYMMHGPIGLKYTTDTELMPMKDGKLQLDMSTNLEAIWRAMEDQVDAGRIKSIGISNFNASQIERIVQVARHPPANLQIELHAYFQQKDLQEVCNRHSIIITAYGPIGRPYLNEVGPLQDPVVIGLADKLKKTPAQILLRFLVQQDIIAVPRSSNPERLKQNIDVYEFELPAADMAALKGLDKGADRPSNPQWEVMKDHPEYPHKK